MIRGDILCSPVWSMSPWGVEAKLTRPDEATGAHRYLPVLETDADLDKLQLPRVTVDRAATEEQYQRLGELFDGRLPITRTGVGFTGFAPVDLFSMWVGLERLLWYLVAGVTWEPEVVRRDTRRFLEQTRGCVVEMVLKDTHTCCHQPHRMAEWVRLAREEAERFA